MSIRITCLTGGCYSAIRIIQGMMYGEGGIGALAFIRGIHEIVNVVGHTDEGKYMRHVVRQNKYAAPFGGIYIRGKDLYVRLPAILGDNLRAWCAVVNTSWSQLVALQSETLVW